MEPGTKAVTRLSSLMYLRLTLLADSMLVTLTPCGIPWPTRCVTGSWSAHTPVSRIWSGLAGASRFFDGYIGYRPRLSHSNYGFHPATGPKFWICDYC